MDTRTSALGLLFWLLLATGCAATGTLHGEPTADDWDSAVASTPKAERPSADPLLDRPLLAQAPPPGEEAKPVEQEKSSQPARPHVFNLFAGYATERGDGGLNLGIQYEYKLSRHFGIGFLLDGTFVNTFSTVGAVPLYYHPIERIQLLVAPGVDFIDTDFHFITRVGGAYEFDLGRHWKIAPAVYADLFAKDTVPIIAGVYFSQKF